MFYKEREERIAKSAKERIPNPVKMFRGLAIRGNNWGINTIWHNIMSIPFQLQKSFHPNLQLSSIHTWQTQFYITKNLTTYRFKFIAFLKF